MQHSCLIQGIIPLDMPTYQRYGGKLGSNVRSRMVKVIFKHTFVFISIFIFILDLFEGIIHLN